MIDSSKFIFTIFYILNIIQKSNLFNLTVKNSNSLQIRKLANSSWINNLVNYGPSTPIQHSISKNSNGDLFMQSCKNSDTDRYFYVLKSDGRFFFKDENDNEIPQKILTFSSSTHLYYQKSIFIKGTNYFFSATSHPSYDMGVSDFGFELFDFSTDSITMSYKNIKDFIQEYSSFYSMFNCLLEIKSSNLSYAFSFVTNVGDYCYFNLSQKKN